MEVYVIKELHWIESHYKVEELCVDMYFSSEQDALEYMKDYIYEPELNKLTKPFDKDGVTYVVEYFEHYYYDEDEDMDDVDYIIKSQWEYSDAVWRYVKKLEIHK